MVPAHAEFVWERRSFREAGALKSPIFFPVKAAEQGKSAARNGILTGKVV